MILSDDVLFQTSNGTVLHCSCCGQLEITFLGGRIRLAPADFATVAQTVAHTWRQIQEADASAERWHLTADTDDGPVRVTFSPREIAALHELLHGASVMMELDDLLADTLQP